MAGGNGSGGRDLEDPLNAPLPWEKRPAESPPSAGRTIGDPFAGLGPASNGPDLELDELGAPAPSPTVPLGAGRVVGDPFEGLTAPEDMPSLELEEVQPALRSGSRPRSQPAAQGTAPAPSRASSASRSHLDLDALPPAEAAAPTPKDAQAARIRDRLADPAVRAEVMALADYGEPPANLLGVVPYTVLVLTRQHAMRKERKALTQLLGRAKVDTEEAETALGKSLHARRDAEGLEVLAAQMAEADRLGAAAGEHTGKFEVVRQAAETQRSALEQKIDEIKERAGPYRDRETKLATQMDVRETDLRRASAKHNRVEIELRNLRSAPTLDAARIQLLEAEGQARKAEVDVAQGHVDELAPKLAEARRELAVIVSAQNDLESQKRAVDQAQSRSEKAHQTTASQVGREYDRAARALATAAITAGVARQFAPERTNQVQLMRSAQRTRERELELYEAAFEAHDKSALIKGGSVLAVAGLVVLTMILFVLIR